MNYTFNDEEFQHYCKQSLQFDKVFYEEIRILSAAISNDLKFLAAQDIQFRLILWDLKSYKYLRFYKIKQVFIEKILFSDDSKFLIFTYAEQNIPCDIQIFQVNQKSAQPYASLIGHESSVSHLAVTSDSKYLLSGGHDEQIILWNLNEFWSIQSYQVSDKIEGIAISENQSFFSLICYDGQSQLFSCKNMENTHQILKWRIRTLKRSQYADASSHSCIQFTDDSQKIITCQCEYIKIWIFGANRNLRLLRQIQISQSSNLHYQLVILDGRFVSKYQYYDFEFWDLLTGDLFESNRALGIASTVAKDYKCIIIAEYNRLEIYERRES